MTHTKKGRLTAATGGLFVLLLFAAACAYVPGYGTSETMTIPIKEFSTADYPEDPAGKSVHSGRYADRRLKLIKKDDSHFDFIFEPLNQHTATVIFKNVDVSLMTPSTPEWIRGDENLVLIGLTDRQWNRQQVSFKRDGGHVEVTGGNGFEQTNLVSAELAKNCLNAGLWEVLLFTQENGQKALYYQGWFTFPMGHYKTLFEANTNLSYWDYWRRLAHWADPAGTPVAVDKLRTVKQERPVQAEFLADEPIFASGEQQRKIRTLIAKNLVVWKDFYNEAHSVRFASFVPPGVYNVSKPWKNEFWRLSRFIKAELRDVETPASPQTLQELELTFESGRTGEINRFIVSGFEIEVLPQLAVTDYPKGLYMPMGIGIPPFYQSYEALEQTPPYKSPYFSVLLDTQNRWINHHEVAVDGVALHRDKDNPHLLHLYLLSYERHTLIGHFQITIADTAAALPASVS